MKFKYKKYGPSALRPVIPIRVIGKNRALQYEVLVDSGADLCIFDEEVGKAIGIDVRKGKKREVFGVGGKSSVYFLHNVEIEVGGWKYKIQAGFMPAVAGRVQPYGIVGQTGFFESFVVKFDLQKESVELRRK